MYWHRGSVRNSGACRFVYAVDFGAHSIHSPSSTLQGTFERGTVWYVSHLVFMAHQHTISPFSSPPQKLLSKSSSRGLKYLGRHYWRPPDKLQKVCLHHTGLFHVAATGWLTVTLVCRCKTPATRRDWLRGRGCGERDDRLYDGQADARASNDVGRGASYFEHETWRGRRANPAGMGPDFVHRCSEPTFCDQNYEHLFKANAPAEAPPTNAPGGRGTGIPRHSHYLQSKVVRARERIEAELEIAREEEPPATAG